MGAGNATRNDCTCGEQESRRYKVAFKTQCWLQPASYTGLIPFPPYINTAFKILCTTYVLHEEVEAEHGGGENHQLDADVLRDANHAK
jgi:hypothetical protein